MTGSWSWSQAAVSRWSWRGSSNRRSNNPLPGDCHHAIRTIGDLVQSRGRVVGWRRLRGLYYLAIFIEQLHVAHPFARNHHDDTLPRLGFRMEARHAFTA